MPAYSDKFPFKNASPVAPPPLSPDVINGEYKTSWATIIPEKQPICMSLNLIRFVWKRLHSKGRRSGLWAYHPDEFQPDDTTTFPMVPHGLAVKDGTTGFSKDQSEKFNHRYKWHEAKSGI